MLKNVLENIRKKISYSFNFKTKEFEKKYKKPQRILDISKRTGYNPFEVYSKRYTKPSEKIYNRIIISTLGNRIKLQRKIKNQYKTTRNLAQTFYESMMLAALLRKEPDLFYSLNLEDLKALSMSTSFKSKMFKEMTNKMNLQIRRPKMYTNLAKAFNEVLEEDIDELKIKKAFNKHKKIQSQTKRSL